MTQDIINKVLKLDPLNYKSLLLSGKLYYREKEYQKAVALLARSLAIKKDETVMEIIADCLDKLGDIKTLNKFHAK